MQDVRGVWGTSLPEGMRRLCRVLGALLAVIPIIGLGEELDGYAQWDAITAWAVSIPVLFFLPTVAAKAWFWIREGFRT